MTREEAMTRVKGILTDCIPLEDSGEIDEIMEALEQEPFKPMVEIDLYSVIKQKYIEREVLDKIRAEIEKAVWEDVVVSLDGTDEVRIPRLEPDDVFEIIDKYRGESGDKE